jgi:tripartite-type tricarboxylate transporter receptor subunit TctC
MGHVQNRKLKAFAVTGATCQPQMPNVPTNAEAGMPGFRLEAWVGLFAPAGTPPTVVAKLAADVKRALELPEVRTRADAAGVELRYQVPEALAKLMKTDLEYWSKTIKSAAIKLE